MNELLVQGNSKEKPDESGKETATFYFEELSCSNERTHSTQLIFQSLVGDYP